MMVSLFIIFLILDIYTLYYLHKSNKELKQEVIKTRKWCLELINGIVEQEKKIDVMLAKVADDLYDSNNNEKLTDMINNIKDEQKKMVNDLEQKFEDFPGV